MDLHRISIEEVDVSRILPLRKRVLRPHYPAQKEAAFSGDNDPDTHHFTAILDETIVGIVSYFSSPLPHQPPTKNTDPHESAIRLRCMAVHPEYRNQGIGSHLLTTTIARLPLLYLTSRWIWCHARINAVHFYQQHQFQPFGNPFSHPESGLHRSMKRRLPQAIA